jgi:hypothetical protein
VAAGLLPLLVVTLQSVLQPLVGDKIVLETGYVLAVEVRRSKRRLSNETGFRTRRPRLFAGSVSVDYLLGIRLKLRDSLRHPCRPSRHVTLQQTRWTSQLARNIASVGVRERAQETGSFIVGKRCSCVSNQLLAS